MKPKIISKEVTDRWVDKKGILRETITIKTEPYSFEMYIPENWFDRLLLKIRSWWIAKKSCTHDCEHCDKEERYP